jgi:hypothetical protein
MAVVNASAARLVADVRRRGVFGPADSGAFPTQDDILSFLNDEIDAFMVPLLEGLQEEHFVAVADRTTVPGVSAYELPARAMWGNLRDVQVSRGGVWRSVPRLQPEQVRTGPSVSQGAPVGYYVQANSVVLFPVPSSAVELRLKYYRRPSRLALTGYTETTGVVGTMAGPSSYVVIGSYLVFGTIGSPIEVDILGSETPFAPLFDSLVATPESGVNGAFDDLGSITENVSSLGGVVAYAARVGTAPVAQLPYELLPTLTARATGQILLSQGNPRAEEMLANAQRTAEDFKKRVSERTKGLPRKIVGAAGNAWTFGVPW